MRKDENLPKVESASFVVLSLDHASSSNFFTFRVSLESLSGFGFGENLFQLRANRVAIIILSSRNCCNYDFVLLCRVVRKSGRESHEANRIGILGRRFLWRGNTMRQKKSFHAKPRESWFPVTFTATDDRKEMKAEKVSTREWEREKKFS